MGLSSTWRRQQAPIIGPFSISLRAVQTLRCGIVSRSESLLYCRFFSLSEPPMLARFTDGITHSDDKHQLTGSLRLTHGQTNHWQFSSCQSHSVMGFSLHRVQCLHTPLMDCPLIRDDNARPLLWAPSRLAYGQSKPSAVRLSPVLSSYSPAGISPAEPSMFACSPDVITPTQR